MPFVETRLISPTTLTTSASSALYTVPTGYSAIIKQLVVTNITGTAATFTFYIGAASAGNALFSGTSVAANDTVIINLSQVLTTGETLRALASTNSALNLTVSGVLNDGPLASTATYIADNAITVNKIADGSVTSAKIADSLALTGVPTAPTATAGTNTTQLATTAFVTTAAANVTSGFRNLLINGAMQVSQRSAVGTEVLSISTNNYFTTDRWQTRANASVGVVKQATVAEAPTGSGFRNSIKTTVTTAGTTFDANQSCGILQRLEGQNLQAIRKGTASAQTVTLSFWVKSNKTGTYIAELFDADNTRQVSKSYTINAVDVWEYKTITYPADVTGAFDNDNSNSLIVEFWLASSTTYTSGTLNTVWAANVSANRAVGQTNLTTALTNYWQMTGAQLTVGSVATPFEFKSFADDLRACQRYYHLQRSLFYFVHINGVTSTSNQITKPFMVQMRTTPSGSTTVNASNINSRNFGANDANTFNHGGGMTSGNASGTYFDDINCTFSAEL